MSVYRDDLTTECIIEGTIKLKKSFPALGKDFFDVFSERIKNNDFTDKRLVDAINNVIDNCIYPTPTIAQFISFNNNVKLYTYDQVCVINDDSHNAFEKYKPIVIENEKRRMYAHISDIEAYELEFDH